MTLKIVRGPQRTPVRAVIYGTEGIGKTTLAAQFPEPLILDTEDGSSALDVARVSVPDWGTLEGSMLELARDPQGFKTVVIDSADWAERQILEQILRKAGKRSVEDFGFGKGYTILAEHFARLLTISDQLVDAGLNVVFVAHSKVQRTSPPDQDEGYDRYELKLTKQSAPLLKEWCDLLLFANYETKVVEGADGRKKAKGGKARIMHAQRSAAWDAKNRFGLPESMPMGIEALAPIFGAATKPATKKPSWRERVAAAATVEALGQVADAADQAVSAGKLTPAQREALDDAIEARHRELEPMGQEAGA